MIAESSVKVDRKKFAILIGVLAGFGFAFGFWGIGSIELLISNGMFPFSKFLVGGAACTLTGLLAGWLTWRLIPILANVFVWALVGWVFNRLSLYITFPVQERLLAWLDPVAGALVSYPLEHGVVTRATLLMAIMIAAGGIAGVLANSFVEEAATSEGFRRMLALLIWTAAFIGVGMLGDSLNHKPMRTAVDVVNEAIQFTREHAGEELPPEVQTQMGVRGLRSVSEYIDRPYRLIPAEYDQMMVFIKVLVKFDNFYATCSVINNSMGTCFPVTDTP